MKPEELKLRIVTEANSLIDVYFSEDTFIDKMANTTLKILVKQNQNKLDEIFEMFKDEHGEIDAECIINDYANMLTDDGVQFDLKQFVKNDMIRNALPNKFLIISKDDILKIIHDQHHTTENGITKI